MSLNQSTTCTKGHNWKPLFEILFNSKIIDPDGWRREDLDIDLYECTWKEFCNRAIISTVSRAPLKMDLI